MAATPAYCFTTLQINMDEKPEEITIHCNGKITAESAYMFEREVRDNSIPVSRGKGVAAINRIVLDLSNVSHIDNAGLGALLFGIERVRRMVELGASKLPFARSLAKG